VAPVMKTRMGYLPSMPGSFGAACYRGKVVTLSYEDR
jgi:hypothetical protein